MSVIIRLQNLPWSANSLDIRGFFRGLSIPDGGVHIVGGEQGDAFIAFSTDEDARQAMMLDGGKIKEVGVRLLLSSRAEMQKVIETARKTTIPFMQLPAPQPPVTSSPLSGLLTQQMLQQQLQQQTNLENFMNKPPPVFPDSNLQMSFGQNQQINQLTPTQEQTIQLPLLSTPIIVKDNSNDSKDALSNVKNDSSNEGKSDNKNNKMRNYDRRDKRSRSRSKSRSRSRDRRRSRSRDRGNSRRRRDRSRSRDRRDRKKRDNRSRSRERSRDRSYDRERSKDKEKNRSDYGRNERRLSKDDFPQNKISTSQIWDIPLNSMLQNQQLNINRQTNVSNSIQPFVGSFIQGNTNTSSSLSTEEIVNLHKLNEKRNQNAFQSGISVDNNLFQTLNSSSTFKSNFDDQLKYDKQDNKTIDVAGRCVKISNMDTITGYGDIRRFFFGLHISINGIRMINDQTGRRTGSACVQFMREESKRFALERDGMRLRNQTVTVTSIADDDYDNAVDSFRPTYESDDDVTIVSSEQISEKTVQHAEKSFTTLQVEDLPPFAKEQDIMKMFSNYTLLHIVIVREKDNSRRYMAYVKFHRAEDAKAALGEISNHLIAHKKVHVSVCDEIVYEAARQEYAEYLPSNSDVTEKSDTSTTSERSKPFSSTRWDGADQSKNSDQNSFNNLQEKIIQLNTLPKLLEMYSKPRQTNCPDPRHVLRSDPRQELRSDPRTEDKTEVHGDPRIFNKINDLVSNLITGTQQFQNRVSMDPRFNSNRMLEPKQLNSEISDCVVISNLESKTTNRDVIDFFSDIGIVPRSVHILLDKSGQPSGDCFCEFITPEDATRALTKNSCHLGMNQVNVESIPREKVDDILSSFKDLPLPSDNMQDRNELMSLTNQPFGMRNNYQMRCGRMTGLRFGNIGPPNRSSLGNNGNRQPFMRPNMPISMMGMGPNLINQNENGPGSMPLNNGCVISMENVPYRAGVQDILEFFSDFDLKAQDIMRRFNDSGKPTGDARVLFSSQIEAKRAVDIKNHQKIQGRTIYLNIVGMIE